MDNAVESMGLCDGSSQIDYASPEQVFISYGLCDVNSTLYQPINAGMQTEVHWHSWTKGLDLTIHQYIQ